MDVGSQIDTLLGQGDLPKAKPGSKSGRLSVDEQIDYLLGKSAPGAIGEAPEEPFKLDPSKDWDAGRQLVDAAVFGNYSKSDPKLVDAKKAWEEKNGALAAGADLIGHIAPAVALSTVAGQIIARGSALAGAPGLGQFLTGTASGNTLTRLLSSVVGGAGQGAISAGYNRYMGQPDDIKGGAVIGGLTGPMGNLLFAPLESSISPQIAQLARDYARQGVRLNLSQIPGAPKAVSAWSKILGMGRGGLEDLTASLMRSTGSRERIITPETLQDARDAIKTQLSQIGPAWRNVADADMPATFEAALDPTSPVQLTPSQVSAIRLAQNQWHNIGILGRPNLADAEGIANPQRLATAVRASAYGGVDPSTAARTANNPVDVGILARGANEFFPRSGTSSVFAQHPGLTAGGIAGAYPAVEHLLPMAEQFIPHLPLMLSLGGAYGALGKVMDNPLYLNILLRGGLGPVGNPLIPAAQQLYGNKMGWMADQLNPITPAEGRSSMTLQPDDYAKRLFQIESGGKTNAVTGSNYGLGQFSKDQFDHYGITNWQDPSQQARAVAMERAEHGEAFRKALYRDPSPGESYLLHQQGEAGGLALLQAGDQVPAWQAIRKFYGSDSVAKRAISGNLPDGSGLDPNSVSARDFASYWVRRFENVPAGVQVAPGPTSTGFSSVLEPDNLLAGSQ